MLGLYVEYHDHAALSILLSSLQVSFGGHHDQGDIHFSTLEAADAENRRYTVKRKR